ncbi:MAG: potassium/proton antiporter [Polyangia bacterium]
MTGSHELILVSGVLCVLAIFAGLLSARIGTPLLLVFIGVGMLAGEDGPGGIKFDDFRAAYLVGSLALAVILFQGGLHTERAMIKRALGPSILLATLGVALTAGVVGIAGIVLFRLSWPEALLLGAVVAPTDAAAVSVLLRAAKVKVPPRVVAALELESGLNDPMSVFLTVALVELLLRPETLGHGRAALMFAEEMGGGIAMGLGAGYLLVWLFRRLTLETSIFPVLALGAALAVFGGAQSIGASGFLAVYLMGVVVGTHEHPAAQSVERFFGTLGWLAQITLFLMLGLLVTPHLLGPLLLPALAIAGVLIFVARPIAGAASLLPFRYSLRESAFVSWVGLRGAVPIYLTIIPVLEGVPHGVRLFGVVFVIVVVSVALQGWTIGPVARLLRLDVEKA